MSSKVLNWYKTNHLVLTNASSIIISVGISSGLGFVYWWLAARLFPPAVVGLSSAAISAMLLLGNISMLGLGTMLIGELPRQPLQRKSLILTALLVTGGAGTALGIVFALVSPYLSPEFKSLGDSPQHIFLFAAGVGLLAVSANLDQVFIGLLRSYLQLWRNIVFAVVKLLALIFIAYFIVDNTGLSIYGTWVFGIAISMLLVFKLAGAKVSHLYEHPPKLSLLSKLGWTSLSHHILNLSIEARNYFIPIIVTIVLSAQVNASYYIAATITGFIFVPTDALTKVLYAIGADNPNALAQKIRFTLRLSLIIGLISFVVILCSATLVLSLFGRNYVEQAEWSMRIQALSVFPMIIKQHYVAIVRIYKRFSSGIKLFLATTVLELVLVVIGAIWNGLVGVSIAWVVAVSIEALIMGPLVFRTANLLKPAPKLSGALE